MEIKAYTWTTSFATAAKYVKGAEIIALDFETAPDDEYRDDPRAAVDPAKSHITTMSISVKPECALMIPVAHKTGKNMPWKLFLKLMKSILTNGEVVKVIHNAAFESQFAYKYGIVIQPPVYDTMCAAMLTLKEPRKFRTLTDSGLKTMANHLFKSKLPTFSEVAGANSFDELKPDDPDTLSYSCADADYAFRIRMKENTWFDRHMPGHRVVTEELESKAAVYVGMMRFNGIPVDVDKMQQAKQDAEQRIEELRTKIETLTGGVSVGSNCGTKAFKTYLFEEKGLPVMKRTEKGQPSVDDESIYILKDYSTKGYPEMTDLFDLVLDFRKWQKLKSTYLDGYLKYVNEVTQRIHPDLLQLATQSGRFACRGPNLQNMPQPGADPIGVRDFVVAPDGWMIMEADYSQAEIRLCAYLSQDQVLLDAYKEGADVHAITTAAIFGIPLEEAMDHNHPEYKHRRTVAKSTMFGIMYGIGPAGLSRNLYTEAGLNLTKEECASYIQEILNKYHGVAEWQKKMKEQARQLGYVETAMGRRRYLPAIYSKDPGKRASAERMAINTPVQGLCADCLKYAMGLLLEELSSRPYIKPILTVHDSLVFLVKEEYVTGAAKMIKQCMETPPPNLPDFPPLVAEVSAGKTYGSLTELEL